MVEPTLNLASRLTSSATSLAALKARIGSYLSRRSGVSIAELCRDVPGFTGFRAWRPTENNIVIWSGMSEAAIEAMTDLIRDGEIAPVASNVLVYAFDGAMPDMPVASRLDYPYATPHWFPFVFQGADE